MTLNPTLSSGNYTTLRGDSYRGETYISVLSNRVVYAGLLSATPTGTSITQLSVDTTTGSYSNVRPDMRIQVAVNSTFADVVFDGRVRKVGGSGATVYISETSREMLNNYSFRVLDDYPIVPRKPRIADGVFYVDYDQTFETLPPLVTDLQPAYAGFTSGGVLTISFAPTVTAAADGATVATYAWEVDDGTITTGTSSDKDITATFPAGERWVHLTVTDSNGATLTRHILVLAYDDTDDAGLLREFEQVTVSNRAEEGATATVTTYADLTGWLPRQLVVVWTTDDYDGATTPLDNNIAFYGRRASVGDQARYNDEGGVEQESQVALNGTIAQLAEGIAFPATLDDVASATVWFEVKSLTVWRGMYTILTRFTTAASVVGMGFDDTGDTYRIGDTDTQGATAWDQLTDLAQSLGAAVQETRDGRLTVSRYAVLLEDQDDRLNVPTWADWTDADYFALAVRDDDVDTVASVTVYAGSYNTSTGVTEPYQVIAPGEGYGTGASNFTVNRQILKAGADAFALQQARKRAGNLYAQRRPVREVSVDHPDGYWWIMPDVRAWVTFDVPAGALVASGAVTDGFNWWCREVSVTHNAIDGTREVTATYVAETEGREGAYIPPQIVESNPFVPPDPVVFPEPDPGIEPGELPMEDVDTDGGTTDGSYNAADDSVDADCNGTGTVTIGGWDFSERCVAEQGISLGYAGVPEGTLTMTLSLDGTDVKTSSWGISGTQVLQALDDTFADSVRADRVDITLAFGGACVEGTLRVFGVRVNEDVHSDGCDDATPDIHYFDEVSLGAGIEEALGALPYKVTAVLLHGTSAASGVCGFGRDAFGSLRASGGFGIVAHNINASQGNPESFAYLGDAAGLATLENAGINTGGRTATVAQNIAAGSTFTFKAGGGVAPADPCYPILLEAWVVMDLNT